MILRIGRVLAQIEYLDEIGRDQSELGLRPGQPKGLDDEISRLELRMEHQVVGDEAVRVKGQHVTVL